MEASKPRLVGHEVIICTRNRSEDLRLALAAVARSSHDIDVLVVDSSDDDRALDEVENARTENPSATIRFLKSEPGLTVQRNVGLDHATGDYVHFIDDDTEVFPDYFARVAAMFEDPAVVGAGGVQDHIPPRRTRLLRRIGQIEAKPGRLSASAVNNLVTVPQREPIEVEWLSGCCMAFRLDPARRTRFNEDLSGYSLGEDVEFSLRIGKHGRLLVDTSARVHHHLSPVNRGKLRSHIEGTLLHRRRLIHQHPQRFNMVAFWWSVGIDGMRYAAGAAVRREGSQQALRGLLDGVRSVRAEG